MVQSIYAVNKNLEKSNQIRYVWSSNSVFVVLVNIREASFGNVYQQSISQYLG